MARKRAIGRWRREEAGLTFGADQAAVVPDRAAVLEHEDGDGHDRQTHDEHHHPDRRTVGLYGGGGGGGA